MLRDSVVASAQRLRAAPHRPERPERAEYKRSSCAKELRIYTKGQAKLELMKIPVIKKARRGGSLETSIIARLILEYIGG